MAAAQKEVKTQRKNFCGLDCKFLDTKRDFCSKYNFTVPKRNLKTYWRAEACKKEEKEAQIEK